MAVLEVQSGFWEKLNFDDKGLIPAIIQEAATGQVLMMAYMNKESLENSLSTGRTCFFSRSRQRLWTKGETSGNYQEIVDIAYDCDADTLLVKVIQQGNACHTGTHSCFTNQLAVRSGDIPEEAARGIVDELFEVIKDRQKNRPEGSYTTYLFNEGQDKILKKVGEEATEVIIGSKNNSFKEIQYEMADLMYHCMVLLVYHGMKPGDILEELAKRR